MARFEDRRVPCDMTYRGEPPQQASPRAPARLPIQHSRLEAGGNLHRCHLVQAPRSDPEWTYHAWTLVPPESVLEIASEYPGGRPPAMRCQNLSATIRICRSLRDEPSVPRSPLLATGSAHDRAGSPLLA